MVDIMPTTTTTTTTDALHKSKIANWYAGKKVLITGATGFMGKVLVEKLLRSCPDISTLYLLVRAKRGLDPQARKEQFLKCVIFNRVLTEHPEVANKIRIVKGDLLDVDLGLSAEDVAELTVNVDVIFHCAANVRFDQPLRPMVQMNVVGTLKLLRLAARMQQLLVFVHTSTSYCQCNESVVEERAYAAPHNPYDIIELVVSNDDATLAALTPNLLQGLPNTYAYSKALSEDLICRFADEHKLPVMITRPSIVTAALEEPLPGWIEGVNGPTGLMMGAARGVIRSMHCNPEYASTVIPVDKAINGMICAGYERAHAKGTQVEFCNLCVSSKLLLNWGESIEAGRRFFYETPLSYALWYPDGSIKKHYWHHMFCVIFFHYLPAYFIDFFLLLCGQKPFLLRVQRKISTGLKLLQYYTTKDWDFRNERFMELSTKFDAADQAAFNTCVSQVNWEQYIRIYILGMRRYICKEKDESIPQARRLLRRLYILDRVVTFIFYALIFWFLWTHLDSVVERSDKIIRNYLSMLTHDSNTTIAGIGINSEMTSSATAATTTSNILV